MKRRVSWAACTILLLALVSNQWHGWSDGIRYLSASDIEDGYMPVAQAAPALPSAPVPFHKAQRFVLPYLVGFASRETGVPIALVFTATTAIAQALFLLLLWRLLPVQPPRRRLLAFALFTFQPYALRYYWIVPGMVSDVTFELGTLLAIAGLSRRSLWLCWAGMTLAVVSRQTALLLLPGVVFWVMLGREWSHVARVQRILRSALLCVSTVALYVITGRVAARFGSTSGNIEHLTGLLHWLLSPAYSTRAFGEHLLRCTLPLFPAAALFFTEVGSKGSKESYFLVLMAAAVASQPFLAGPLVTGQNAARLVTLGLPLLALAWGTNGRPEWSIWRTAFFALLLFAGSFHHLYTVIGPSSPMRSAALQIGVVLGAAALAWRPRAVVH